MNTKEFLNKVSKEIKYKPANKPITEELESHIEEAKKDYLCKGYSTNEAEEIAVKQMGDAKKIGKELNKIHRPKLDWILMGLIIILFSFRIILSLNSTTNYINVKYLIVGLLCGTIIYFFDYRKTKNCANLIYFTASMILIFQWLNWYFEFDMDKIHFINMRLWNVCIPLYIISVAGYMADYKKEDFWNMTILYTISCLLIYMQSSSITNTLILVFSYLTIIALKMLQDNKKNLRKVIVIYGGTLITSLIVMLLMTNIHIAYIFNGDTTEENYAPNGYWYKNTQEHENKILSNLKWFGATEDHEELDKTDSSHFRFLYILGKLGIIPATVLAVAIIFMCVRIVKNSKKVNDIYGKYLIIGLGTTYIMQAIIHVLMNLKLWIRSDINLPFVAEGSLYHLINCFTFAVILSVYRRKDINFEKPRKLNKSKKFEKLNLF